MPLLMPVHSPSTLLSLALHLQLAHVPERMCWTTIIRPVALSLCFQYRCTTLFVTVSHHPNFLTLIPCCFLILSSTATFGYVASRSASTPFLSFLVVISSCGTDCRNPVLRLCFRIWQAALELGTVTRPISFVIETEQGLPLASVLVWHALFYLISSAHQV